jgi:glycerophosphoryl diester phosphodiesterase
MNRTHCPFALAVLCAASLGATGATAEAPLVIAHRGASGYLPEHTLVGVAMAYGLGADVIEQDVVLTRDGTPIVLHDLTLDATTNVAIVFPGRAAGDGKHYAADFSLEEVRRLSVVERRRPDSRQAFPTRFPADDADSLGLRVPTLADEIRLIQGLNRSTGGDVGLIVEPKDPAFHRRRGLDLVGAIITVLAEFGYTEPDDGAIVQCFDAAETLRIRRDLRSSLPLCQLVAGDRATAEGRCADFAGVAQAIGPPIEFVLGPDGSDTGFTKRAAQAGLAVFPYTLRRDALPDWAESEVDVVRRLEDAGVTGYFTDFPAAIPSRSR